MTHLRFDWDPKKATANWNKHRIRFEDAILAFDDPFALIALVVLAPDEDVRRIISARLATRAERKRYEESKILPF